MNIITWIIECLTVSIRSGDLEKVIVTADWRAKATDSAGHFAESLGSAKFLAPDPATFKPFNDLQPEDVLGWVWASGVDKAAVEASLNQQIADQINPPLVILPPPWNQPVDAAAAPIQAPAVEPVSSGE